MSDSVTDYAMVFLTDAYGAGFSINDLLDKFWDDNGGTHLYGKDLMDFMLADEPTCEGDTIADRSLSYWKIKADSV